MFAFAPCTGDGGSGLPQNPRKTRKLPTVPLEVAKAETNVLLSRAGGASAVDTAGEQEEAAGAQPATAQGSAAAAAAAQRHATTDSKGFPKIDADGLRGTLRSINANVASSSAGATAALSAAVGSVGHTPFPL